MEMHPVSIKNTTTVPLTGQSETRHDGNDVAVSDDFRPGRDQLEKIPLRADVPMPMNNETRMPNAAEQTIATPVSNSFDNSQAARQLEAYLTKIISDPEAEAEMIQKLAELNQSGQLKPVLHQVALMAAESGTLPPIPEQKRKEMVEQLANMIDAEFRSHGMVPGADKQVYASWEATADEHLAKINNTRIPPRGPGELSCFTEPDFLKELEALQGATFCQGNRVTPLIDGPASFAERDRLIDNAVTSIHMMTWAFYDDETGWETARKLVAKHKEGVDVKVAVDGQVAERTGHGETLKFMEDNGIKTIRWRDPENPYNGQHRKALIVDNKAAIAGGLNAGNVYSHKGPKEGQKWRDTDVLLEGPAVADCEKIFASVCDQEANPDIPQSIDSGKTAVVNHTPGKDANIMLATMKAIQGASESIDIENAYFIETPGIRKVLMDALARGVHARILTNSAESVDEQIVTAPILRSLPDLISAGAEVYLKQGDTLHSKLMVIDGIFSSVGSYNLHPRSERYEGEMTINTLDTRTAGALTQAFEKDIIAAKHVKSPDEIKVPENILTVIASRYFFDQL